jgi:hypothetical protein
MGRVAIGPAVIFERIRVWLQNAIKPWLAECYEIRAVFALVKGARLPAQSRTNRWVRKVTSLTRLASLLQYRVATVSAKAKIGKLPREDTVIILTFAIRSVFAKSPADALTIRLEAYRTSNAVLL